MKRISFDNTYARLPSAFYSLDRPEPSSAPKVIKINEDLAKDLGISADFLGSKDGLDMLSGRSFPEGAEPLAMAYAGHQFGGWSPQLGDGRAHLLGEILAPDGNRFDLHLKGSGRTKFSRAGDGKAALGPVLREYIVSEAMHHLGVPTSRSLAAISTGDDVFREGAKPGAILARIAKSHIRIGSFQYFYGLNDRKNLEILKDYVIERHFPEALESDDPVLHMFQSIALGQAKLIAKWMSYGFIHGVMNTDNMQIAGETIDFGPCAFMDEFHPLKVFSSIDVQGRYAWARQPSIAIWNLSRLGEALLPVWGVEDEKAIDRIKSALDKFGEEFNTALLDCFAPKFGLARDWDELESFIEFSFDVMAGNKLDFTLFFSRLSRVDESAGEASFIDLFEERMHGKSYLVNWRAAQEKGGLDKQARTSAMMASNPIYIARNHQVENVINHALEGSFDELETLLKVLKTPFDLQEGRENFETPPSPDEVVQQTFCGT